MSKSGIILEDFLNSSLYKKSITMMFSDNKYKSLIIDDLYYIQNNDKKLYKSIINFSKQNSNKHPIIYIFDILITALFLVHKISQFTVQDILTNREEHQGFGWQDVFSMK